MLKYKECCVHQAAEWVAVMLSESTALLTSTPIDFRRLHTKISEDEAEVFPNPWRCPYTILKKETKQKPQK